MRDTRYEIGSALILTVVLTSLLAVIGVMFVMTARVDKMATSAISENRELNFAVETVIAEISQELVLDVPGLPKGDDYYDYPDRLNVWLASLEPYESGGNYYWRQISDVTGYFSRSDVEDVNAVIVGENDKITDPNDQLADADGDGVADSKWIELENIISNKGRPIYAAIRVIDNGGMININTVFANPGGADQRKGDKLTNIYIDGLVKTGTNDIAKFLDNRGNFGDAQLYHIEVSRRIENPDTTIHQYTLYDTSDELELRNRYIIFNESVFTRLESKDPPCLGNSLQVNNAWTPVDDSAAFESWKRRMDPNDGGLDPGQSDNHYSFRKLLTTYNMDRIIDPTGGKMLDINDANAATIYQTAKSIGIDQDKAAQIAVNLVDYRDDNSDVTDFNNPDDGITYYGFEAQPFISEIGIKIDAVDPDNNSDYAVEFYNPFNIPIPLDDFTLSISDQFGTSVASVSLGPGSISANGYYVIANNLGSFTIDVNATTSSNASVKLSGNYIPNPTPPPAFSGWDHYNITLKRTVNATDICLDSQLTQAGWFNPGTEKYLERDDNKGHILYQNMVDMASGGSLGILNTHTVNLGGKFNLLPFDSSEFVTVGDVARMLTIGPSEDKDNTVGKQLADVANLEEDIRVDLENPDYGNIFQYLTVFDPTSDGIDNDGDGTIDEYNPAFGPVAGDELKVPGRININTAPWYVIAQLPWMTPDIARAVVSYRDKPGVDGFESIGDLMQVAEMYYYKTVEVGDLTDFPDLTHSDGAADDFEERDVIFSRISNLVTVRSDVFTAYILVRIGADGPQKRAIAILDRSDVYSTRDKVKVRALHPVPDPR